MKILKCENGHYFDHDAYQTCPLCGAAAAGKSDGEKKGGLFHARKADVSGDHRREAPAPVNETVAMPRGNFPENAKRQEPVAAAPQPAPAPAPQPAPAPAVPAAPAAAEPAPAVSGLKEAIQQNSSLNDGKTLSYFSALKQSAAAPAAPASQPAPAPAPQPAPAVTPVAVPVQEVSAPAPQPAPAPQSARTSQSIAAQPADTGMIDPVVGWLVCIGGAHLYGTFNLAAGLNSIGRNPGNKIVLAKDPTVSREKHAFVTFEPRSCKYYVRPGDSSGLTYLNDEYIYENKPLNAGDIISLGQSRFYFQPLCGENFNWENFIQ